MEEFRSSTYNLGGKGTKIRGELLTSLLLIADELDLHYSRAKFKKKYPLSNVSKLHHFRHHFIENVEVIPCFDGINETHRTICITYHFPRCKTGDNDKAWQNNLQEWVQDKIKKEAMRTAPYLREGFLSYFSWANPLINYKTEPAREYEKQDMEKAVRYLLSSHVNRVIDWKEITRQLSTRFKEKTGGVICITGGKNQGIERLITFIVSIFYSMVKDNPQKESLAILNFSGIQPYHTSDDLCERIAEQLGIALSTKTKDKSESIIPILQDGDDFYLVILQHLDKAGRNLIEEVNKKIIQRFKQNPGKILFLITTDEREPLYNDITVYSLPGKFEENDVYQYFLETGDTGETARAKLNEYQYLLELTEVKSPDKSIQIVKLVNNRAKTKQYQSEMSNGDIK